MQLVTGIVTSTKASISNQLHRYHYIDNNSDSGLLEGICTFIFLSLLKRMHSCQSKLQEQVGKIWICFIMSFTRLLSEETSGAALMLCFTHSLSLPILLLREKTMSERSILVALLDKSCGG